MNWKDDPRVQDLKFAIGLLAKNPLVLVGSILCVAIIIIALLSNFIVNPSLANAVSYASHLCWGNNYINWGPNSSLCRAGQFYWLGTDFFGRGVLSMIILALPLDLEIAFTIVLGSFLIGLVFGGISAYGGQWIDETILRVTDIFLAFPSLLLAIVFAAVAGPSIFNLTVAVLIVWWPIYVRLVRGQILAEKEKNYVEALRSIGAGNVRILFRHIIPNTIYPVLVQATLDIGGVILVFSSLMFLGFSPRQNLPELGNLVAEGIQNVFTAPWLIIFPGLAIVITTLAFNLVGDGLRDVLDPRLRR
ncbi:MAG TPA: ABC transporter permease [Nitrososphaerales archaeon]|nr:ABC transporter permease [Nitrososphaerales archaeon]